MKLFFEAILKFALGQITAKYEALKKRKFNDGQIEKFWSGNVMRVMREVL